VSNEKGYVLVESLIGLMLLALLASTFLGIAPLLLEAKSLLNLQQSTYNQAFEIRTQNIAEGNFQPVCLTYEWRGRYEEICL